jgi:outer membrane protein assembly factor BamA
MDPASVFARKTYLGGKLALVIDNRNNELFPTRGMLWTNDILMARGMGTGAKNIISYTTDMKVYASLSQPAKLVAILKLGGGRIYSKNFEYFQAMNFGANNSLYSFRKNRYAGRGSIYGSLEMRVKIADVNSYILPGVFGFTAFYDVGRVYHKDAPGNKGWHTGYGGGFYYIPFNLFVITATAGYSEGEKVFNFSLGTRINLTY